MSNADLFNLAIGSFSTMGFGGSLVGAVGAARRGRVGLWALNLLFMYVNAFFAAYHFLKAAS